MEWFEEKNIVLRKKFADKQNNFVPSVKMMCKCEENCGLKVSASFYFYLLLKLKLQSQLFALSYDLKCQRIKIKIFIVILKLSYFTY